MGCLTRETTDENNRSAESNTACPFCFLTGVHDVTLLPYTYHMQFDTLVMQFLRGTIAVRASQLRCHFRFKSSTTLGYRVDSARHHLCVGEA